eukprot:m.261627 g.261627  ORF g.261627 m.261627 type:complete len:2130 (+) comp17602_c0_seq2:143-6532(+)
MDTTAQRQKNLQSQLQKALSNLKTDLQQPGGHVTDVAFSLQEVVHTKNRNATLEKASCVADAKPLEYQHERLEALQSVLQQSDFAEENLAGLVVEFNARCALNCSVLRYAAHHRGRTHADREITHSLIELTQQLGEHEVTALEQNKRFSTPGSPGLYHMDLESYLGRVAYELSTSRTYHLFLNRLRWVALGSHDVLRNAMQGKVQDQHPHIHGGIGDVFTAHQTSASATRRATHGQMIDGQDGEAALLVRSTLPLNTPQFNDHRPWCMLLALRYQLEYSGGLTDGEQLDVYFQAQRCFETRFKLQLQEAKLIKISEDAITDEDQANPSLVVLRESKWIDSNDVLPQQDAKQEQRTSHLQALCSSLDELLSAEAAFAARDDMDYAMLRLRQRAATTARPVVKSLQVASFTQGDTFSGGMWTDIYSCQAESMQQGRLPTLEELAQEEEEDADATRPTTDRSIQKNGFLATLYLRHIHLRDLQHQARAWLNYFRSIERRVHHDLLMLKAAEDQRHNRDALLACLQAHEDGFMHDTYTLKDDTVRVHNLEGQSIQYTCVSEDYAALEQELLALGTHYLQRHAKTDFLNKSAKRTDRRHPSSGRRERPTSGRASTPRTAKDGQLRENADFAISLFAQGNIDRGAVLLDLWLWEVSFLREKQRLLSCMLTAYELTVDARQRQTLLQSMVDLLYRRPLYDLEAEYFVESFHIDTQSLRRQRQLYLDIIKHLLEQHQQAQSIGPIPATHPEATPVPGQYPAAQAASSLFLHDLEPHLALGHVRVEPLAFIDSMGVVATLESALKFAIDDAQRVHRPSSLLEFNRLRAAVIAKALEAWTAETQLGGYDKDMDDQLQQLMGGSILDRPAVLINTTRAVAASASQAATKSGGSDRAVQKAGVLVMGTALELVTLYHRLQKLAHESIVLTEIYSACCASLNVGEHHAHLRPMTFATAGSNKLEAWQEDTFVAGRYALAMLELDASMLKSSCLTTSTSLDDFLTKSQPVQRSASAVRDDSETNPLARRVGPLGDLTAAVEAQMAHRHTLMVAVDHLEISGCFDGSKIAAFKETIQANEAQETGVPRLMLAKQIGFVSAQLVKADARQQMHERYLSLMSVHDPYQLRREMVSFYATQVTTDCQHIALRTQLGRYLASLRALLAAFPSTRDYYFLIGSPELTEKRRNAREVLLTERMKTNRPPSQMDADATEEALERQKRTPLQMLSKDGQQLLNLWYLPYVDELPSMYDSHPATSMESLKAMLELIAPLHDIIMFLCAHARLGSSHARLGTYDVAFQGVGADWGGAEGIGTELRKIKRELGALPDAKSPSLVAEFLQSKRKMMFLEWDLTTRFYVRETFLSKGNLQAFNYVTQNISSGLPRLAEGSTTPSAYATSSDVLPSTTLSKAAPLLTHKATGGVYAICFPFYAETANDMEICLAKLNRMERHIANGEVLGVSLLLEDITEQEVDPNQIKNPIQLYSMLRDFLKVAIQLEQLRFAWAQRVLGMTIDTPAKLGMFTKMYDAQVVVPVVAQLKLKHQKDPSDTGEKGRKVQSTAGLLVGHGTALEIHGVPEVEYRSALVKELQDQIDCALLSATIQTVTERHQRLVEERAPADGLVPYHVWLNTTPKATRNKAFVPSFRPPRHVARYDDVGEFAESLLHVAEVNDDHPQDLKLPVQDLSKALRRLSTNSAARERERYLTFNDTYKAVVGELHRLLASKERQLEQLKLEASKDAAHLVHTIQCGVADRSFNMVYEITALRAKVSQLREEQQTQARDIRESVKRDYDDLVNNLFSTSFSLKNQFEEYRLSLYEDVVSGLYSVRQTALQRMKMISVGKSAEKLEAGLQRAEDLRNVQSENASLTALVLKMRTMNDWKRTGLRSYYGKQVHEAVMAANATKQRLWEARLMSDEQRSQHQHELTALRAELVGAKKELESLQNDLESERRARNALQQWKASKAQLIATVEAQAKKYAGLDVDIDELMEDLDTCKEENHSLKERLQRAERQHAIDTSKLKHEFKRLQTQLSEERAIKNRLLLAQSQATDVPTARPQTAPARRPQPPVAHRRPGSAAARSSSFASRPDSGQRLQRSNVPRHRPSMSGTGATVDDQVMPINGLARQQRQAWGSPETRRMQTLLTRPSTRK